MDQQTIDTYNNLAQKYDEGTADFWKNFPSNFIDEFATLAKGRVLNIGSGPGRDAELLRKNGLEVVCLDASEAMIRITQEKGFESVLSDLSKLPLDDQSFDGVWAYTSLLHIPKNKLRRSFEEIKRVLKNEGVLALGLIEGNFEGYKESSGLDQPRWFSYFAKEEIREILKTNGFETLHFDTYQPASKVYLNFIAQKL